MKLWSSQHIFGHTWDRVTQAIWRKYPNKLNPNVVEVDVLERKLEVDGTLHTVRVLGSTGSVPSFLSSILGFPDVFYALEYSVVDPVSKTMTLRTVNYTFSSVSKTVESIRYFPNPDDISNTLMTHDVVIKVNGVRFKDYCEGFIANTIDFNAQMGRQAVEQVIAKISLENIFQSLGEQMDELKKDFDMALTKLDTEFGELTAKLNTEFSQLIQTLSYELDHMTITMETDDHKQLSNGLHVPSLTEAVKNAGLMDRSSS